MVVIKNLIETDFDLLKEVENKQNKNMQQILKYVDKDKFKALLPKKSKKTVTFELYETNASFANGIRRCLADEIETISFDFDEYADLHSDDVYILSDFIKKQLDLLPINQELDYSKAKFILHKKNDTDEIIDVLSGDISYVGSESSSFKDMSNVVDPNIFICRLYPRKFVKITKIVTTTGIGIEDGGKFNLLSNVSYKIIDVEKLKETPLETTGKSSMIANPKKFRISYSTHRNIDHPKKVMKKCCDTLIKRLSNILIEFKNIKNDVQKYASDLINVETAKDQKKIYITGEYWTLINMIVRYVFDATKGDIEFISPALVHPEKEVGVINIKHPEFSTLIQNSIKKIIKDLEGIKSKF